MGRSDVSVEIEILDGKHDDALESIIESIKMRRATIASALRFKINAGDTVTFSDAIRPKYLAGKPATVVKVNRGSVVVSCPHDDAYGRFSGLKSVRCPLNLINI
jgi:hypothetical protein